MRRALAGLLIATLFPLMGSVHGESPDPGPFDEQIERLKQLYDNPAAKAEAETEGKRLLAAVDAELGPDSPEAVTICGILVHTLMELGKKRVPEAVGFAERAVAMAERMYGPDDIRVAGMPLQDLGDALDYLGAFEEAYAVRQRVLEVRESALGSDDLSVASALGALANSSRQLGDYAGARLYFERALAIHMIGNPKGDKKELSGLLYSLAEICRGEGDLEAALEYARRGQRILETGTSSEKGFIYMLITSEAATFRYMGRYAEAAELHGRCLRAWSELGTENSSAATAMIQQAVALAGLGRHEEARSQAERALQIATRVAPPEDRTLAFFLGHLADVHVRAGDDATAEPLLERAIRIKERAYGATHVALSPLLDMLSKVEYRLGKDDEALEHALRGESIAREGFQDLARILSERQVYRFESSRAASLQVVFSALSRRSIRPAGLVERVWDEVVRSRALVLDEMTARHRAVAAEGSEVAALARDLKKTKSRLATFVLLGASQPSGTGADPLTEAQGRQERLERELARTSAEYRRRQHQSTTGLSTVRSALPPGSALLSYVEYERPSASGPESQYAAFVLPVGSAEPRFIPLGPARPIEDLVVRWKDRAGAAPPALEPPLGSAEKDYREAAALLRLKIWDPLSPALAGARTVFVVPDGALHLVSLATLPVGEDGYLLETGPIIHYVSTERDLVRHTGKRATGAGSLVLGGPDLDMGSSPVIAGMFPGGGRYRSPSPGCQSLRTLRFDVLPGARQEAAEVTSLLKGAGEVREMTGASATEEVFKSLAPGRRLLHVATHGFFMQGTCESALRAARAGGEMQWPAMEPPPPVRGDNPLLLSGLALAGANRRGELPANPESEDGILTAEEVGTLDLSSVEWAVLSACETGVGEVLPGEGVLGLRRAFAVAGAGSLIMSLWRVDDEATRAWMAGLYRARGEGASTVESVSRASRTMLEERRRKGKSTHPFHWGGFVAEGDWRQIRSRRSQWESGRRLFRRGRSPGTDSGRAEGRQPGHRR
ncbi:MAG: CHAT domain-containing protein [Candidatus Polarisedimenticolia bacterium]